jgi:hypothetical protein
MMAIENRLSKDTLARHAVRVDRDQEMAGERGGSSRSTAWQRSAAGTGFVRTGAASRIKKAAYSDVYPRAMEKMTGGMTPRQDSFRSW